LYPDIWEGNATTMREIAEQLGGEKPDVVVCSVGGGDLLNGIMQVIDEKGWGDEVEVLAMETEGADSRPRAWASSRSLKGRLNTPDDAQTSRAWFFPTRKPHEGVASWPSTKG
jgi:threonine dehydratase